MRRWLLDACGMAVVVLSLLALAPAASAQDDVSDDARTYFEQGRAAYEARRYEEAARLFRRAYLLSGRAGLLYNVGQAELRLGRDSLALEAFEGFLRRSDDRGEMRAEVEERVRVLRSMGVAPASESEVAEAARAAREAAPASSGEGSAAATSDDAGGVNAAPWIVVVGGAAAVAVGAVLLGVAANDASRVSNAPDGSTWRGDLEVVASQAQTMWIAGWVVLGVGAAAAVGGIVWALAGGGSEASAELRVLPNGLVLAGTF